MKKFFLSQEKEQEIVTFLREFRESVIGAFEKLEGGEQFVRTPWNHVSGGGGEMAVLRGKVFEKAAVNFSAVEGPSFPMQDGSGPYFATGVSLITHMQNPHAPTVHMNIRYIRTEETAWFAGGYDLTPMGFPYPEDSEHFHRTAKETLDPFSPDLYPAFSLAAREYFFLPHRNKERGVGGIFFDHYNTGSFDQDFRLWKAIGSSFLPAILPIYQRRIEQEFLSEEKEVQNRYRGHYAEFNLAYDRGTKFGFASKGNTEAILCSMPPMAKW